MTGIAAAMLTAFNLAPPAAGEVGTASSALNAWGGVVSGGYATTGDPKVFVTIILFDREYNPLDVSYKQLKDGVMSTSYTVRQPGYAYLYVSNENPTFVDVYVDDVTMSLTPSPIVQMDEYYPFGLSYNSSIREHSVPNKIKFQGQEHVDDLGLNWDSFKWRNHQPDIGRFFNIDPLADKYVYNSPYAFSENKVVRHVELEGLEAVEADKNKQQQQQQTVDTNSWLYKIVWAWFAGINEGGAAINRINGKDDTSFNENVKTMGEAFELTVFSVQMHGELLNSGAGPGAKKAPSTVLEEEVAITSKSLKSAGKYPAAVVGAELPNGATSIITSGDIPTSIAPSLAKEAEKIGGVGAKRFGNTIGCCAEFRAANQLLLDHTTFAADAVKFTPAIRPRTGQIIPPCQNCIDLFNIK